MKNNSIFEDNEKANHFLAIQVQSKERDLVIYLLTPHYLIILENWSESKERKNELKLERKKERKKDRKEGNKTKQKTHVFHFSAGRSA